MKIDNYRTIAIIGDRNRGKTNLMFNLINNYKGNREIVFYGYPKELEYKQIYSLEELAQTTDSIIVMDELQNHIKFYRKATNDAFLELLAVLAHNNNTLIFSTPMSQFITKALDVFIDAIIYVNISDMASLKNGSKAKRLLQQNSFTCINRWGVNLPIGKYLLLSDYEKGVYDFSFQNVGKDWRKENNNVKKKEAKELSKRIEMPEKC